MTDAQGVLGKDWQRDIRYPLVFPLTAGAKFGICFIGLLLGSLGALVFFLLLKNHIDSVGLGLFGLPALGLLLVTVYSFVYASRACLTLEADAIEVRKVFGSRRVERRDILGRRLVATRNGKYRLIVTRTGADLNLQGGGFGLDDRFNAWFNALLDLDEQDRAATLAEVSRDASLGASPEERLANLSKAKRLGAGLNIVAVALFFWGFMYPKPYGLVMACAAVLPWLAAVLLWTKPGLFQFDGRQADVKPNVAALILMPPMLLGLRAMIDLTIVDLGKLFEYGVVVAAPLFLAVVAAPRNGPAPAKGRTVMVVMTLLLSVAYGAGLLALTDAMWDHAPPDVYQTAVTGKDVSRGKSTTYYVQLAPWNKDIDENRISVSRGFYDMVEQGDTVCVRLHPGRFGLRWMQLGSCSR